MTRPSANTRTIVAGLAIIIIAGAIVVWVEGGSGPSSGLWSSITASYQKGFDASFKTSFKASFNVSCVSHGGTEIACGCMADGMLKEFSIDELRAAADPKTKPTVVRFDDRMKTVRQRCA